MKGSQIGTKTAFPFVIAMFIILSCLYLPSPAPALMALPDIGINYQTMKVIQAAKLTATGMTNVRNGDTIAMRFSPEEGKIFFKNVRTNEEIAYPPAKQKGKER
jgi:hypothetical protein